MKKTKQKEEVCEQVQVFLKSQSFMEISGFSHVKLKCIMWILLVDSFLFWNLEKFSGTPSCYWADVQNKALESIWGKTFLHVPIRVYLGIT